MQALRHLLLALQYFTRIPLPHRLAQWVGYSPAQQAACMRHFPAVGAVLGLIAASVLYGVFQALPALHATPWIAAILSTATVIYLTGALHEDGLADLSDGLGGTANREHALAIMKDSRIGSFGALALLLAVFLKVALLVALVQVNLNQALVSVFMGHVCSRWSPLWIVALLPHARPPEQSKSSFADQGTPWLNVGVGGLWVGATLVFGFIALGIEPLVLALLGLALPSVWMFCVLKRRLQGFTGDALGATQQLSELGFYLGVLCASAAWAQG